MVKEFLDFKFCRSDEVPQSLKDVLFENCSFIGCDLKLVNFSHSRLIDCIFKECDLSNLNFANARIRGTQFSDCKMLGLKWVELDDLTNPSFHSCNLSYGNFTGLKLRKNSFINCLFEEVDFTQADLSECNFSESNFLNARFLNTNIIKSNFSGTIHYQIDPTQNMIRGAKFSLPEAMRLLSSFGIIIDD